MTAAQLQTLVDSYRDGGEFAVNGMRIRVRVTDARETYGRIDLRVVPEAGSGFGWIERRKVTPLAPSLFD
jgi:hypothetical protein